MYSTIKSCEDFCTNIGRVRGKARRRATNDLKEVSTGEQKAFKNL